MDEVDHAKVGRVAAELGLGSVRCPSCLRFGADMARSICPTCLGGGRLWRPLAGGGILTWDQVLKMAPRQDGAFDQLSAARPSEGASRRLFS